jgi:hypothetical protein
MMKNLKTVFSLSVAIVILALGLIVSCSSSSDPTPVTTGSVSITDVVNSKYKSAVTITVGTTSIVLKSKGVPDHVTAYWGVGNVLYEAPSLAGQVVNPGNLQEQVFVMTIPVAPATASSKEETSLGPIGMALNGVAIYNDREGGNVPVDDGTLLSFDRGGAHSGPGGLYHYHFNGDFTSTDDAKLIGFLRDGFPIYGRKDADGTYPSDLDSNGGHTKTTTEFTKAIYHYHTSNTAYKSSRFYVLKSGSYNGTKGTFTF